MDNDDLPVGRILTRREALRASALVGLSLATVGLMSKSSQAASPTTAPTTQPRTPLMASPTLTEGPFFVEEKLNRSNLIGDTKRESVIKGIPLLLHFTIYKLTGKEIVPMPDAQVDVWHADANGVYSDENNPMNHENTAGQTWLRGYQITDALGLASFRTIIPGWYEGRAPHVHFKVRQFNPAHKTTAEFTSQLFLTDADIDRLYKNAPYAGHTGLYNSEDGIYSELQPDGSTAGSQLTIDLKTNHELGGHTAYFPIILTEANLHNQQDHGPGGRGPGGPGGPGDRGPDGRGPGGPGGPRGGPGDRNGPSRF